ncbi:MAG TPA: polysaccharide deacetylase family protein [Pyrinomonadaceae bacterium]|nr:polysaccharide deacetylase family protein [Pyrinomonadaceae bacterium]
MASVLVYHSISSPAEPMAGDIDISKERFTQQLQWLARGNKVVRLEQTMTQSRRGAIAITFDDGFRDNLTVALPLLEKYNLPMTLFVVAGFVDSDGYLTEEDLREIAAHPLITIGSHGLWHRHFNRITLDEARFELTESKRLLEDTIGKPIDLMAWPYGECSAEVEELAGECGYRAGWAVWQGTNGAFSRWRVPLGRNDNLPRFIAKASGVYGLTEAPLHRYHERRRQKKDAVRADGKVTAFGNLDTSLSREKY